MVDDQLACAMTWYDKPSDKLDARSNTPTAGLVIALYTNKVNERYCVI